MAQQVILMNQNQTKETLKPAWLSQTKFHPKWIDSKHRKNAGEGGSVTELTVII